MQTSLFFRCFCNFAKRATIYHSRLTFIKIFLKTERTCIFHDLVILKHLGFCIVNAPRNKVLSEFSPNMRVLSNKVPFILSFIVSWLQLPSVLSIIHGWKSTCMRRRHVADLSETFNHIRTVRQWSERRATYGTGGRARDESVIRRSRDTLLTTPADVLALW